MQKLWKLAFLAVIVAATIVGNGCSKKAALPVATAALESPTPPPAPLAPSIAFNASPIAIERGQSTSLAWESSNTTAVSIDNGIGNVDLSGTVAAQPASSTTYKATATGPGGTATAEVRVTVIEPPSITLPSERPIADEEFFNRRIHPIYFSYDRYTISDDARDVLIQNAKALAERPSIHLTIEGHCDERGSEKYNLALGDMRANAAKEFLVNQGVNPDRIDTISYGKERPFCSENNEQCWQQNRRAHPVIASTP
jgi:peptidoglycan-associated lipoprotein